MKDGRDVAAMETRVLGDRAEHVTLAAGPSPRR